jgi:hypothetical protein
VKLDVSGEREVLDRDLSRATGVFVRSRSFVSWICRSISLIRSMSRFSSSSAVSITVTVNDSGFGRGRKTASWTQSAFNNS